MEGKQRGEITKNTARGAPGDYDIYSLYTDEVGYLFFFFILFFAPIA